MTSGVKARSRHFWYLYSPLRSVLTWLSVVWVTTILCYLCITCGLSVICILFSVLVFVTCILCYL